MRAQPRRAPMAPSVILARAFAKQHVIEMSRYAFDTVAGLVLMYALFVIVFFGVKGVGGVTEGQTLSSIVLGFNVWALLVFAYSSVATGLLAEAQTGTLEQLAMSPQGLLRTVLIKFGVSFVFILLQITTLLIAAMATTGRWLHVDLLSIVPLLLVTAGAILGLGLVMGGLALVFKRVQAVSAMLQLVLLVLVAVPADQFPIVRLVPISLGYKLLNNVMVDGLSIAAIPVQDLLLLLGSTGVCLLLGFGVFKKMESIAKDRGLLGQY